jgi:hypothetical protein
LRAYCRDKGISSRGNLVVNTIKNYRNIDDLYLENLELIGSRDLNGLREKGLGVKESELGSLYETSVKKGLEKLGLNVDEKLRRKLNNTRLQMDVVLRLGEDELIVVECKTTKDRHYNKYTPIKRQLLSYQTLCEDAGYRVRQLLVVANEYSDDFVRDCDLDIADLSLSLLRTKGLTGIIESMEESRRTEFPIKLLMKGGLLDDDRIGKALCR